MFNWDGSVKVAAVKQLLKGSGKKTRGAAGGDGTGTLAARREEVSSLGAFHFLCF